MKKISAKINSLLKSRLTEIFIFLIILILGFAVRTYRITFPIADWHSWRQVDTASVSRIYLDEGIDLLKPRYYDISRIQTGYFNPEGLRMVEFPIYNALHALLVKYLPISTLPNFTFHKYELMNGRSPIVLKVIEADSFIVWGRLISIVSSLVSAYVLYVLGARYINRAGGLLAAFLFLFIPFNIYFTRVILPEPITVTFGLLAILFFSNFIQKEKIINIILSGVCMALALLEKPYIGFYGIPMIYLAVNKYGWKKVFQNVWFYIFVWLSFMPFFIWRWWEEKFFIGIPHYSWAFNGDNIRFKPAFWKWIFGERVGHLILGGWGLIPLGLGIATKAKNELFGLFLFLGSLAFVFIIATASVRHDYYQILVIPSLAFVVAQGLVHMWNNNQFNVYISRPLAVFCVFMIILMGYYQVKDNYQINHYEIIDAGKAVQRLTPKDAKVIAPYNGDTAFLYHTGRFGWPVVDESIEGIINLGATHYVSVNMDNDTNYVINKYKVLEKTDKYIVVDLSLPRE